MDTKHIVTDLKSLKKEHVLSEIKTALNIVKLDKTVMTHVAGDAHKTKFGYYIIAVAAIASFLGTQLFGWFKPTIVSGLISMVIQAVMMVVGLYVVSWVAKKFFKGAATHDQFFRVAAYGMILGWAYIHPTIGMLAGIWGIVVSFVVLKTIHKLTTAGVIGTWIVTFVLYMVVGALVAMLGLGSLMGGGYSGGKSTFGGFNFKGTDGKSGSIDFSGGGMKIKTDEGEVNFQIPDIK